MNQASNITLTVYLRRRLSVMAIQACKLSANCMTSSWYLKNSVTSRNVSLEKKWR
uniref:Uncharacterized protein n=1 Tax=Octopus bimaculoides TaxID=37653 RepID=A0A0L8FPF6_OCTBM